MNPHRFPRSVLVCAAWFGLGAIVWGQTSVPAAKLVRAETKNSAVKELRTESEITDKDAKDPIRQGSFLKNYSYSSFAATKCAGNQMGRQRLK